jgi:hypothetical protein
VHGWVDNGEANRSCSPAVQKELSLDSEALIATLVARQPCGLGGGLGLGFGARLEVPSWLHHVSQNRTLSRRLWEREGGGGRLNRRARLAASICSWLTVRS